jgi:hypothetical protein
VDATGRDHQRGCGLTLHLGAEQALAWRTAVQIDSFLFGSVRVDGHTYHHDVVIDRGRVRERRKGASKRHRESYGHTPLSAEEEIPWGCRRLVIGTGAAGALPVMEAVRAEAHRRHVELVTVPTEQAIDLLADGAKDTNAILHVTC